MKTFTYVLKYLTIFFLGWEIFFRHNFYGRSKHVFYIQYRLFENPAVYDKMLEIF
jgi:hypothetical protein